MSTGASREAPVDNECFSRRQQEILICRPSGGGLDNLGTWAWAPGYLGWNFPGCLRQNGTFQAFLAGPSQCPNSWILMNVSGRMQLCRRSSREPYCLPPAADGLYFSGNLIKVEKCPGNREPYWCSTQTEGFTAGPMRRGRRQRRRRRGRPTPAKLSIAIGKALADPGAGVGQRLRSCK